MIITDLSPEHIKVQDVIGSDKEIASRARICVYGQEVFDKEITDDNVRLLIKRLITQKHTSPFEFAGLTLQVKCPIFVARQWMRHRTFRYLERSGRYCNSTEEIYLPEDLKADEQLEQTLLYLFGTYNYYIDKGMSKQEARVILPLGTYTEFVFQADLHNLLHFLKLRLHPSAQPEMRFYAQVVADKVAEYFPITWEYFSLELDNDRKTTRQG